jgi:hypothetical protein
MSAFMADEEGVFVALRTAAQLEMQAELSECPPPQCGHHPSFMAVFIKSCGEAHANTRKPG